MNILNQKEQVTAQGLCLLHNYDIEYISIEEDNLLKRCLKCILQRKIDTSKLILIKDVYNLNIDTLDNWPLYDRDSFSESQKDAFSQFLLHSTYCQGLEKQIINYFEDFQKEVNNLLMEKKKTMLIYLEQFKSMKQKLQTVLEQASDIQTFRQKLKSNNEKELFNFLKEKENKKQINTEQIQNEINSYIKEMSYINTEIPSMIKKEIVNSISKINFFNGINISKPQEEGEMLNESVKEETQSQNDLPYNNRRNLNNERRNFKDDRIYKNNKRNYETNQRGVNNQSYHHRQERREPNENNQSVPSSYNRIRGNNNRDNNNRVNSNRENRDNRENRENRDNRDNNNRLNSNRDNNNRVNSNRVNTRNNPRTNNNTSSGLRRSRMSNIKLDDIRGLEKGKKGWKIQGYVYQVEEYSKIFNDKTLFFIKGKIADEKANIKFDIYKPKKIELESGKHYIFRNISNRVDSDGFHYVGLHRSGKVKLSSKVIDSPNTSLENNLSSIK